MGKKTWYFVRIVNYLINGLKGCLQVMTWKPGESGNPNGLAKHIKPITDELIRLLRFPHEDNKPLPKQMTNAQALARVMMRKALEGDNQVAKEIIDRVEGKAKITMDVEVNDNSEAALLRGRERIARLAGLMIEHEAAEPQEAVYIELPAPESGNA